ncbi:hypothetical protein N0V91_005282 [Didymella pomorum]|uniref:Uncharacterized protein n=1 Tax=Didymella pomorum TaxID=749634 RepID=A0A9W8ZFJ7_9PLEO|nr:hypothetical protein N0V91_005282 [Didymella pomorum]
MPAIAHLAPRFLEGGSSGGISGSAIAVLVIVGIIPVIALIWVCIWLLFFYSNGRNCCCMRRKTAKSEPSTTEQGLSSAEILNEKNDHTMPQRPVSAWRTESGSSNERPRDSRGTLKKQHHPRESMQSQWSSNSTIGVVQEPKQVHSIVGCLQYNPTLSIRNYTNPSHMAPPPEFPVHGVTTIPDV